MIHSKDQKIVWLDKREINHIISGLNDGIKILEESGFKDETTLKEILLYIHKLKEEELSTELFTDINSIFGLIGIGLNETEKYFNENKLDGLDWTKHNNGIAASAQFMEKDAEYSVITLDDKYLNSCWC